MRQERPERLATSYKIIEKDSGNSVLVFDQTARQKLQEWIPDIINYTADLAQEDLVILNCFSLYHEARRINEIGWDINIDSGPIGTIEIELSAYYGVEANEDTIEISAALRPSPELGHKENGNYWKIPNNSDLITDKLKKLGYIGVKFEIDQFGDVSAVFKGKNPGSTVEIYLNYLTLEHRLARVSVEGSFENPDPFRVNCTVNLEKKGESVQNSHFEEFADIFNALYSGIMKILKEDEGNTLLVLLVESAENESGLPID